VGIKPENVKVAYVSTDITKAFNDPGTGKSIAQQMIGQKADVIFQVAGLSGAGAIEAACAAPGVIGIGVDVDQSKSLPDVAPCIVTSAEKKLQNAVKAAIERAATGKQTDNFFNDASNDGIGLSPFTNVDIPADVQSKIDAALNGFKDGSLDPCKPTACDDATAG
jgi:basic membrane protein A